MVEQKPSFCCLNRSCTAANLQRFPPFTALTHYMTVFSPVSQVRALRKEDISEWCMSAVARTGKHYKVSIDFSREQNCISVKWKERILNSYKSFEICCFCHTDRCTVEILAPDDIVSIFYFYKTRIVSIYRHEFFPVFIYELNLIFIKVPVNSIFASAKVNIRDSVCLLTTEHTDEFSFIRNYCTVENSCNFFDRISSDDRVFVISPYRSSHKFCRFFLPRYVWHCRSDNFNFAHCHSPLSYKIRHQPLTAPAAIPP